MASAALVAVITQFPGAVAVNNVPPEIEQLPGLVVTANDTAPVPSPPVLLSVAVDR